MRIDELATPALVVDDGALDHNLRTMSAACPGARLRPHVKAHKCTSLAWRQRREGHPGFTCATPKEILGLAAVGLGDDLLLANEVVDAGRLEAMSNAAAGRARITLAVDSDATIDAAARAGLREVVVDVNVGLPRCGCAPEDAGRLAEHARRAGLTVRGVMGYEGHTMVVADRAKRRELVAESMQKLLRAHADVGGELVSAGGTGSYDLNTWATEIQAGSYVLMDTAYEKLGLPFRQAFWVLATVVSVSPSYAVADAGLKALGMDHGNPRVEGGQVWFCSDEHLTFAPDAGRPLRVGDRVRVTPAHVDPTIAYHERMHVLRGDEVVESWEVDLRGW